MPAPIVTDQEFIDTWKSSQSISEAAQRMGYTDQRSMMRRRRYIEENYGPLPAPSHKLKIPPTSLPLSFKKATGIIFSDCHFWPQVYTPAYLMLLKLIPVIKPDFLICNGDAFDGYSISRHSRIGWDIGPSPQEEIEACQLFLGEIRDAARKTKRGAKTLATWGNHDIRFDTRLSSRAAEFEGVKGFHLQDHLPDWPLNWSVHINDNLVIKHRWKSGVHAGYNNAVGSGVTMVTGHTHRLNCRPVSNMVGVRYGVECGTLADPQGEQFLYCEHNPVDWQPGFQVVRVEGPHHHFTPVEVVDGSAWWEGKRWKLK